MEDESNLLAAEGGQPHNKLDGVDIVSDDNLEWGLKTGSEKGVSRVEDDDGRSALCAKRQKNDAER